MSYVNLQACDPTVQLCEDPTLNGTMNDTMPHDATSLIDQARSLTKVGLPVLGALQLTAGVMTYLGEVKDGDTSMAPYNYELYMSALNGFFGSVGLAWGLMGLLAKPAGPPGPGDMPPPEPVDGETPAPLQ
jgi:hypothetical protein